MADSPLPLDFVAFEPQECLWDLVEQNVPGSERQEVKIMLGESLVEQSLELHQEIQTLLEIWREYREETEDKLVNYRLPEPPAARDRLKQEIIFFVNSIKEKARDNGRDFGDVLASHNTDVLDYALDNASPTSSGFGSRPSTARSSRDGRETPMLRSDTPSSDRFSMVSSLGDEVETIKDKLNVSKFQEVVQHLQSTLETEVQNLLRDAEYLQQCLDDEADFRCQSSMSEVPTLTDLREERSRLEKDLLTTETCIPQVLRDNTVKRSSPAKSSTTSPHVTKLQPTPPAGNPQSCTSRLSAPTSAKLRRTPPSSSGTRVSRPAPVKASHQITAQVLTLSPDSDHAHSDSCSVSNLGSMHHSRTSGAVPPLIKPNVGDPSHLTIRTGCVPKNVNLRSKHEPSKDADMAKVHSPSPPSGVKPHSGRPTSAQRFRSMVLHCRDET